MYVGVDWGGTKIEAIALDEDGRTLYRHRVDTPRSDYRGCLNAIVDLVDRLAAETGRCDRIGIGLPGSLDPPRGSPKALRRPG
jgi:fructokinase